jgi:uncharacterized protein (TIGR03083 family)
MLSACLRGKKVHFTTVGRVMTSLADRTIAALRDEHEATAAVVGGLTAEELTGPSGATEWTVADVLSHLGSGSVITLAGVQVALGQREPLGEDFNPSVWDRWNAMTPVEQRDGFLEHDEALVAAFEALDAEQRASLPMVVGFLPAPLSVASFAGMRLSESAQHSWDVRVARDPGATILTGSAEVLADQFSDGLGFLLGFLGKADQVEQAVVLEVAGTGYGLSIADSVALVSPVAQPTATFDGSLEAALRLLSGRLRPEFTPAGLTVTGNVTLDELRTVFPGF